VVQAIDSVRRRASGRVPPHNLEAEESLLGAMLLSRDAITAAVEAHVETSDFYKPAHGHIYEAIQSLHGQGEPADPVTVAEELRRADLLDNIGGRQALLLIQANTPASANAGHYARIVNELALLRRLIGVAGDIAEMGYDETDDVTETLDRAEALVFEVAERRVSDSMVGIRDALQDTLDDLESRYGDDSELIGMPTGFDEIDKKLHGLQRSNLVILAARPGMGKTSLALGLAKNVAIGTGKPVVFFSMEMGALELTKRLLSMEAGVDATKLWTANLSEPDWGKISHAVGRLAEAQLHIDDNPHCTVMEMRAKARRLRARHGDLGLVIVDYIQLMTPSSSGRRPENRQVEVSEISRGLKILARELECPVIALSQLNRQLEYRQDKRPMLADLRESGGLEQDADVVAFIYRDDVYNPESDDRALAEIIIAKHRNGPTGTARLVFRPERAEFVNMAHE
jgi:replicative DNA helicase